MPSVLFTCKNTSTWSIPLLLSHLTVLFLLFALILIQLYRCLILSPCCRETTVHLSSSEGWWWWWWWEVQAPCSRTLIPLDWKDASRLGDQTLAPGLAAGFHITLTSPADLGHIHVGQQQAALLLVSNLLFVLVSVLTMSRKRCWEENRGKKHAGTRASVT